MSAEDFTRIRQLGYQAGAFSFDSCGPYLAPDLSDADEEFWFNTGFEEGFYAAWGVWLSQERKQTDEIRTAVESLKGGDVAGYFAKVSEINSAAQSQGRKDEVVANPRQFPADFIQVPRFKFPLSDGRVETCALSVLPSEKLVIVTELPGRSLTLYLAEVFSCALAEFSISDSVCVFHAPRFASFHLIEISGALVESTQLFRTPSAELTPAHLRQLVGMLPAIRQTMAEGGEK